MTLSTRQKDPAILKLRYGSVLSVTKFNPNHDPKDGRFTSGSGGSSGEPASNIALRDPPPKGKPISLVFGGSFNPIHTGHVQAALDAKKRMEDLGYTVDRVLIVPTAPRLLGTKLGDQAYPLEDRAAMARLAAMDHPELQVVTEPSVEAENFTGKLRRTQLADWASRNYSGTTIVNVTGEDSAPGEPPAKGDALYSGAKGTSHEGYYYLSIARDMASESNVSSSKIRAALKEGKPVPSGMMHPAAEGYLQEFLARIKKEVRKYNRTCRLLDSSMFAVNCTKV